MIWDRTIVAISFFGTVLLVLCGLEIGYRLGRRKRSPPEEEMESSVSAAAGAEIGLVAFMLAFTFGLAADRFDRQRNLILEEANALGTAWLRTEILPEAERAESKALLEEYLRRRIDLVGDGLLRKEDLEAARRESERIQVRLWKLAMDVSKDSATPMTALYVASLNSVVDLHGLRVSMALHVRVPTAVWLGLSALTFFAVLSMGYQTGISGSRRTLARFFLALSFAIAVSLIVALDHPMGGMIRASQRPLIELHDSFLGK